MALPEADYIWMNGALVPWREAKVHVLSHGLHYGTGVFEGVRAYSTADGPALFRLDEHLDRLFRSAKMLRMTLPYRKDELRTATLDLVRANGHRSCYVRCLANLGYGVMGVDPSGAPVDMSIGSWEWGTYLGDTEHGVRLMTSSWRRNDATVVPTAAKATGPYLNSALAKIEARDAGFDEAVLLSTDGYVSECSGENIFVLRDDVLCTPPSSAGALEGITQDTVTELAADLGITVRRENLLRSDLYAADEVFLCGTAAEVTAVSSIDNREIGAPGPVTSKIRDAFSAAVTGADERYRHWLTLVT
ncbi:branched-chain amino acid transaminase [Saccharopolyspora sp. K220]|uniref:branched-chain amino acid transaminase n=1 Tax=Saccharopolyspora soli TaxID=2926618 RepID=UPI001F56B2CF|nr:branched-chain amino acid transaminase [Saccharopolyspora soli]MCI2418574.1 branched-chain amino acid transaminase [Saccharopolyspora soli]